MSGLILKPQTADVFAPLWQRPSRYKGAHGGRGSAKSNDRAQAVVLRMVTKPGTRVVCLREIQKSIKDSVHQLIADWIERLNVGPLFEVTQTEIRGPGGSLCIFRGMQDHTADSIKSLEGFDVAWFEEAQTCTQRSLDLLRPTIRKPGSELWFTWNPRKRTDPVDIFLRAEAPTDAIVVKADWRDNPWFPDVLQREREIDLAGDEARYRHVWEGDYEVVSDQQLISGAVVARAMARERGVPDAFDETVLGVDVARYGADETVIAHRTGRHAGLVEWETYGKLSTMEVAARVAAAIDRHRPDATFVDEGGVGAGVVDRLIQLGYRIVPVNGASKPDALTRAKCANKRAESWVRMRDWLEMADTTLPADRKLESQLTSLEYKHDANNAILLEKKEDMRKRGLPSPDRADALALTFAYPVAARAVDDWDGFDTDDTPHDRSAMGY